MARHHDIHTSTIALIGVLGALLVFAAIIAIQVVVYWSTEQFRQVRIVQVIPGDRFEVVARQRANLRQHRWVDPERRIVAIPIDHAQERVVAGLAAGDGRFDLPFVEGGAELDGASNDGEARGDIDTPLPDELPTEIAPEPEPIEDSSDDTPQ